jgi:hypothetical protein
VSFDIRTKLGRDFFFNSPEDFRNRYGSLLYSILHDQVTYFSIGEGEGCMDYFIENTMNVPRIVNTKRLVYFGDLAHTLAYNLALSFECPN